MPANIRHYYQEEKSEESLRKSHPTSSPPSGPHIHSGHDHAYLNYIQGKTSAAHVSPSEDEQGSDDDDYSEDELDGTMPNYSVRSSNVHQLEAYYPYEEDGDAFEEANALSNNKKQRRKSRKSTRSRASRGSLPQDISVTTPLQQGSVLGPPTEVSSIVQPTSQNAGSVEPNMQVVHDGSNQQKKRSHNVASLSSSYDSNGAGNQQSQVFRPPSFFEIQQVHGQYGAPRPGADLRSTSVYNRPQVEAFVQQQQYHGQSMHGFPQEHFFPAEEQVFQQGEIPIGYEEFNGHVSALMSQGYPYPEAYSIAYNNYYRDTYPQPMIGALPAGAVPAPYSYAPPIYSAPTYDVYSEDSEIQRLIRESAEEERLRLARIHPEVLSTQTAIERANEQAMQLALQQSFEMYEAEQRARMGSGSVGRAGTSMSEIERANEEALRAALYNSIHDTDLHARRHTVTPPPGNSEYTIKTFIHRHDSSGQSTIAHDSHYDDGLFHSHTHIHNPSPSHQLLKSRRPSGIVEAATPSTDSFECNIKSGSQIVSSNAVIPRRAGVRRVQSLHKVDSLSAASSENGSDQHQHNHHGYDHFHDHQHVSEKHSHGQDANQAVGGVIPRIAARSDSFHLEQSDRNRKPGNYMSRNNSFTQLGFEQEHNIGHLPPLYPYPSRHEMYDDHSGTFSR